MNISLNASATKVCNECKKYKSVKNFYIRSDNNKPRTTCISCCSLRSVWHHVIDRCYKSSDKDYKYYGARLIKVCSEWRNDYLSFKKWMINNGWKKGLQIDRRENDGHYYPENCRIVTAKINVRNRSTTILNVDKVRQIKTLICEGKLKQSVMAVKFGVSAATISDIKYGRSWKDIVI